MNQDHPSFSNPVNCPLSLRNVLEAVSRRSSHSLFVQKSMTSKALISDLNFHTIKHTFLDTFIPDVPAREETMRGGEVVWFHGFPHLKDGVGRQRDHVWNAPNATRSAPLVCEQMIGRREELTTWKKTKSCLEVYLYDRSQTINHQKVISNRPTLNIRSTTKRGRRLTGTLTKVSAINRCPPCSSPPSSPAPSQCNTILPSKCPPTWIAVTPLTISVYLSLNNILFVSAVGDLDNHFSSRACVYTGQENTADQERWVV